MADNICLCYIKAANDVDRRIWRKPSHGCLNAGLYYERLLFPAIIMAPSEPLATMRSFNKIIIKPRRARIEASSSRMPTEEMDVDPELEDGEIDFNDGASTSAPQSASQVEEEEKIEEQSADNEDADADAELEAAEGAGADASVGEEVPVRRGRGRPRGRGKGTSGTVAGTGTGTLRARGRGRGRGRGRARGSFTIRLPRRVGEDGQEEEVAEGDGDGAGGEDGPVGGGKPFRKIQGKVYIIDNDEYVTEDDLKGDTKIDIHGNLLGGELAFLVILA